MHCELSNSRKNHSLNYWNVANLCYKQCANFNAFNFCAFYSILICRSSTIVFLDNLKKKHDIIRISFAYSSWINLNKIWRNIYRHSILCSECAKFQGKNSLAKLKLMCRMWWKVFAPGWVCEYVAYFWNHFRILHISKSTHATFHQV